MTREANSSYSSKTIKNPQPNAILELVHQAVTNMMRTSDLDMQEKYNPEMIDNFIANVGWAPFALHATPYLVLRQTQQLLVGICSLTYHILLTGLS